MNIKTTNELETDMEAIGYIRVSSKRQAKQGLSLQDQRAQIEGWCKRSERRLVRVYETHKSGKSVENRVEFVKAIAHAQDLGAALVVWSLDRFARSALDAFRVADSLQKHGACLVSLKENFDMTTAMGRAMFGVTAVFAQLERERISERCTASSAYRKERGMLYCPQIPYGWRLGTDSKTLEPHPNEQGALELIKNLRAQGYSYQRIADELQARLILTKQGKSAWSKRLIKSILERSKRDSA